MVMFCPYCGARQTGIVCENCNHNIKWVKKIAKKSEAYYQKGYLLSKERKLTQAVSYLEYSIQLNKAHINARNVLGLVYYELGDVGQALKCWAISNSIQKESNKADDYLEMIHMNTKQFNGYKQAITLYNQAVGYLRNNNDDMAVIRLKKGINLHSGFLEARNLLALIYMKQGNALKAMEQVNYVLNIDESNEKALFYLNKLHINTKILLKTQQHNLDHLHKGTYEHKVHKVINRGHVLGTAVAYFIFGLVCMFGVQVALVLPSKTEALELELQQTTRKSEEDLAKVRESLEKAEIEVENLKQEKEKIRSQKQELETINNKLSQQNKIAAATDLKNNRKWVESAEILFRIAPEQLESSYREQYEELLAQVCPKATEIIYSEGMNKYNNGYYVDAFADFEKVQLYMPNTTLAGNSLYYMGMIEEKNNQFEKAKQYYEMVCAEYDGKTVYYKAKERLKKIGG